MPRVAVSGAIAVGKSTLAQRLSSLHPLIEMRQEDVANFRFLESFYQDPKRFAFHSRVEFLAIKGAELAYGQSSSAPVTLFDRVLPELVTFARAMRKAGLLSEREYDVYEDVWRLLLDFLPQFDAFIWVRCDSEICLRRIAARGRRFERGIDIGYLDALDAEYRLWRDEMSRRHLMLSVDTTDDDPQLPTTVLHWLRENRLISG